MTGPLVHSLGENAAVKPAPTAVRENFPVASLLIRRDLRPIVRTFYAFARAADDVADAPGLSPPEKLERLDRFAAGLRDDADGAAEAVELRRRMTDLGKPGGLRHADRLLAAFRSDAVERERVDWAHLMAYCACSAEPVGQFLLDLHEEGPAARRPSDALCAALQVLNHIQDVGRDRTSLGRVYLPGDWLREARVRPQDLAAAALTPALRLVVDRVLDECDRLIASARALPDALTSRRLAGEAATVIDLAARLSLRLRAGDMLAGRIAPSGADRLRAAAAGAWRAFAPRRGPIRRAQRA